MSSILSLPTMYDEATETKWGSWLAVLPYWILSAYGNLIRQVELIYFPAGWISAGSRIIWHPQWGALSLPGHAVVFWIDFLSFALQTTELSDNFDWISISCLNLRQRRRRRVRLKLSWFCWSRLQLIKGSIQNRLYGVLESPSGKRGEGSKSDYSSNYSRDSSELDVLFLEYGHLTWINSIPL